MISMLTTTTQMECQRVRDIRERQKHRIIEVRVLRRWISRGKKEELCYQLVDVFGDCIEAVAEVKHVKHFDSVIQLQCCYRVSGYICTGPRTYMATVDHKASLVFGQKARFDPLPNPNIPIIYFNFATYETLKTRIKDSRILTDYIGRVKKNAMRSTGTGKDLRKTRLQDDKGNEVEITLWPDACNLIGDDVVPGDIVAICSTSVSEYKGLLQLESTHLTTVVLNPDMPETVEYVHRLRALPPMSSTETQDKKVTILDLQLIGQENIQIPRNFICEAQIKEIHEDRGWFYVHCSKCSSKLYPELDNGELNFVCRDDDDIIPIFRYSVNATIEDATGSAEAVFFNESMQALLNISCKDMVTKHADATNPRNVPHQLMSAIDKQSLLHLTVKNDGKIVINSASKVASTTSYQSTGNKTGITPFTPTTPAPKSGTSKRQLEESPGQDKKMKRA
ncbi:hypothetical protein CASFOL_014349 [Castilleja foliolosa]|uniref:Replication factor A C-terminal domain-containing protein n=1 Tax=Castilleja foliolosa TaxID=1961234 RepID=A0ABD3DRB3_9LAMI